jgi:hypothetical protein
MGSGKVTWAHCLKTVLPTWRSICQKEAWAAGAHITQSGTRLPEWLVKPKTQPMVCKQELCKRVSLFNHSRKTAPICIHLHPSLAIANGLCCALEKDLTTLVVHLPLVHSSTVCSYAKMDIWKVCKLDKEKIKSGEKQSRFHLKPQKYDGIA